MGWTVDGFLRELENATALDELQDLISDLRDALGVAHIVYH